MTDRARLAETIRTRCAAAKATQAVVGLDGEAGARLAEAAVEALGAKNVLGIATASQLTAPDYLSNAEALAERLGISFEVRPIKFLLSAARKEIGDPRGGLSPSADAALERGLRAVTLGTIADHYRAFYVRPETATERDS